MHPAIYYLQSEWRSAELRAEADHERLARATLRARRSASAGRIGARRSSRWAWLARPAPEPQPEC